MMSLTDRTDGSWPGAARSRVGSIVLPLVLAVVAVASSALVPATAQAATPYVVAEVASGRVLMSEDATMPWYPASVTKLMTAYVALKQLRAGAISPDTAIPVSSRAASAPPSKIAARPGTEITLENALKMMLVKSANDMAVVVAEGVGGTVENFADMMNREAAAMGMKESRFVNPNGLFVEGQQTSARDMALLARSILLDFPEHADLFSIGAVQLGPRIMRNTNGLVGRYPGIEGMKTGFICASGFNLVAVASRNGRRIVAVVFGQPSAADRTIKAAALLDKGFQTGGGMFSSGVPLDAMPHSSVATPPNVRQDVCVRRKGPPASEEELENAAMPSSTGDDSGMNLFASAPQLGGLVNVRGSGGPRSLAPRTESDPIPVFLGRAPGSATAPLAANAPKAVKPPITATAYAGGKGEGEDTESPILGSTTGPLALKPADNLSLRGAAAIPALKAAPIKTAKAAPGPVPAIAAKANATPPAKAASKTATKPAGKSVGSSKTPATVKPATASALGAKPPAAGKPMVLIIDPKSPGSKPVAASASAKKTVPVPPARTAPKPE